MRKKLLSLALALALCLGLSAPALASGATFTDVPTDYWAYRQIEQAYQLGFVGGTSYNEATGARTYSPYGTTTLAQLLVMVTRYFYPTEVSASTAGGTWYAANLDVAQKHGLIDGFADADMNGAVTREQLVTILYRVVGSPENSVDVTIFWGNSGAVYNDKSEIASYALEAMKWGVYKGIIAGTMEADAEHPMVPLNPKGTATRAQVAVILIRYLEKIEGVKIPAPDSDKASLNTANAKNADGTTNADNVNALVSVGKSNDYPTSGSGSSSTMNANGYFTAADVDISNATLRYEALEYLNAFLESEGLEPAVWTTSDEMEEYCLMRAKEAYANFRHERPDGSDHILAENLYRGTGGAKQVIDAWINSNRHRPALQGGSPSIYETNEVCIASYGNVWVYVCAMDKEISTLVRTASNEYYR